MSARISVIVPLWNARATIARALASLQAQTFRDWQAIVINDGSTDDGHAIAQTVAESDPRIRVVSQSNAGPSAARNAGIREATGHYLHFLDADDTLTPVALARLLEAAENSGGGSRGASFGAFEWINAQSPSAQPFAVDVSCDSVGLHELLDQNRFVTHAQLIARQLVGEMRFDDSLRAGEDWDFWLRLAHNGVRWTATRHVVAQYHLTPSSLSRQDTQMARGMSDVLRRAFARARNDATPGVNSSELRERAAIARINFECATAACLADPTGAHAVAMVNADRALSARIEPDAAAVAAYWFIPHAARRTPADWRDLPSHWLAAVDRFWRCCVREGYAAQGLLAHAQRALALRLVEHDQVAAELVQRALNRKRDKPAFRLVLVGYGRNGRRVAARLAALNQPFDIRDDHCADACVQALDAPIDPRALCLVTPESDARLLCRLPAVAESSALRWSVIRQELAYDIHAKLIAAWPRSGSTPAECAA